MIFVDFFGNNSISIVRNGFECVYIFIFDWKEVIIYNILNYVFFI